MNSANIFGFTERLISGFLPFTALLLCGIYLTLKGGFFQLFKFPASVSLIKASFLNKKSDGEGLSSYTAACTALSATVGTGNIVGVAGAIALGGAGTVFWMWVSAFLGMAVKYGEISLAIRFREKNADGFIGGPMYYIKNGTRGKLRFLGYAFSLAGIPAVICTGNITQTNAAISSVTDKTEIKAVAGLLLTLLTYLVINGGAVRIGRVTEKIVPLMSLLYIFLSLGVILANASALPTAFKMIFKGALSPRAVTGGAVASVSRTALTGAARGVFSNEAGLGTSAMAHSRAYDANSETQGLFGIFEVFADTILICTLTALTILCGGVNIEYGTDVSSQPVAEALSSCFGGAAEYLLSVMLCLFAFSSIIGWAVYGDMLSEFLFGARCKTFFAKAYPTFCMAGALFDASFAWRLSEFFNGIMLCANLPAILLLSDGFLKRRKKNDNEKNKKITGLFKQKSVCADNG